MSEEIQQVLKQVGSHWDSMCQAGRPSRIRWWQSPLIVERVNRLICNSQASPYSQALIGLLRVRLGERQLSRGVSIGCGNGAKEMRLIEAGLVKSFDLYELSEERICQGRSLAAQKGLENAVRFYREDAFSMVQPGTMDLVYWDNALHHMFDVDQALLWSDRVLKQGGVFCMNDYTGPNRFQWSDESLALGTRIRALLARRYLRNPFSLNGDSYLDPRLGRPNPDALAADDPSEAVQSSRILAAIAQVFPAAEIRLLGGFVYHLVLTNILHNFNEADDKDKTILELLLLIDELLIGHEGIDNHYAVALAEKH